jgi:hypothetical protein
MWSRIYLALLAGSTLVCGLFIYYACSWLNSIGSPTAAAEGFAYHAGIASFLLFATSAGLLLVASAVMWQAERAWALWTTFVFFTVFVLLRYFWLEPSFVQFSADNGLGGRTFSFGPLMAVALVIVAGLITFADQFALIKLRQRAYPGAARETSEQQEENASDHSGSEASDGRDGEI